MVIEVVTWPIKPPSPEPLWRSSGTARPGPYFDAEAYPSLLEFTTEHVMHPEYDFGKELGYGLTVILDGLATSLAMDGGPVAMSPASRSTAG